MLRAYGGDPPLHFRPLNLHPSSVTVNLLSQFSRLLTPHQQLRVIAVVCVQLKAFGERYPQYVVFYHLTHPRIRR